MGDLKKAVYQDENGKDFTIEYDPEAPCYMCGYAVVEASMGGTVICGACDCGRNRFTGGRWTYEEWKACNANWKRCVDGGEPQQAYPAPSEMLSGSIPSLRYPDRSLGKFIWAENTGGYEWIRGSYH
jgi:hypothetical protein